MIHDWVGSLAERLAYAKLAGCALQLGQTLGWALLGGRAVV